jgi:hypothetical protein
MLLIQLTVPEGKIDMMKLAADILASSQSRSHSSERSRSTHAFCRGTPGLTEPSPRSLHSADYTDPGGARPCRNLESMLALARRSLWPVVVARPS